MPAKWIIITPFLAFGGWIASRYISKQANRLLDTLSELRQSVEHIEHAIRPLKQLESTIQRLKENEKK